MSPLLNSKGQPVRMSFLDLFTPNISSRSGKRTSSLEGKKAKKEESSSTETSPNTTAATGAQTESTKTTESAPAGWTRIEEMALLGMKAQSMTWKEIGEALPGKDMEDIKKRYRKLYIDAPANVKPKGAEVKKEETNEETEDKKEEAKGDEAKAAEESKKGSGDGKKGGKEGKQGKKGQKVQKGQKGQKGKEKAEEAKPEEAKVEEDKPKENKGILKAKATAEEKGKGGKLKSIDGHPVIFVDDDEELEYEELVHLYALNARYDEQKWITVDSRFFDKFGKRVGAEKLKEKLAGSW